MQQGRHECRPTDGPATLLSPMVGLESGFFPSGPKLVLVGGLLGNGICGGEGLRAGGRPEGRGGDLHRGHPESKKVFVPVVPSRSAGVPTKGPS